MSAPYDFEPGNTDRLREQYARKIAETGATPRLQATDYCMCPNCVAHRGYMRDRRKSKLALVPDNDRGRVWP